MTSDKADAIAGEVGAGPPSIPLHIVARNRAGETVTQDSLLADERDLGWGAGISFVASARAHAGGGPADAGLRPVDAPHVPAHPRARAAEADGLLQPLLLGRRRGQRRAQAGDLVDFFDFAPLHVERISIGAQVRRGVKEDVILRARAPRKGPQGLAHAGAAHPPARRGARHRMSVRVRVPRSLRPGRVHRLTISGGGGGFSEEALVEELIAMLDGEVSGGGGAGSQPRRSAGRAAHPRAPGACPASTRASTAAPRGSSAAQAT